MTPRELRVRRALVGLGLTVGLAAPAGAADPSTPPLSRVATIYNKNRSFRIPFNISAADRAQRRELQLWVSEDQGKTWAKKGVATPDRPSFTFQAPRDGEFWLAVRSLDSQGKLYPSDDSKITPSMKVVVDTTPPALILKPESRSASLASVHWEIRDENPDCESLIFAYQVQGKQGWRPVPAQAADRSGIATWDAGAAAPLRIRALVADRAGNETRVSAVIDASRPADVLLASNVPASLPRPQAQMPITPIPSAPPTLKDGPLAAQPPESTAVDHREAPPMLAPPSAAAVEKSESPRAGEPAAMPPPLLLEHPGNEPVQTAPATEKRAVENLDEVVQPLPAKDESSAGASIPPATAGKTEAEGALPPAAPPVEESPPEIVTPVQPSPPPPPLESQFAKDAGTADPTAGSTATRPETVPRGGRPDGAEPTEPTALKDPGGATAPLTREPAPAVGDTPTAAQPLQEPKSPGATAAEPTAGPPTGPDSKAKTESSAPGNEIPTLRLTSPQLNLPYAVDDAGPNGPGAVELWVTRDGGRTWKLLAKDSDRKTPFRADLGGDGKFGLSLVARDDKGQAEHVPVAGDPPQMWIEVQAQPKRAARAPSFFQRAFGRMRPAATSEEAPTNDGK